MMSRRMTCERKRSGKTFFILQFLDNCQSLCLLYKFRCSTILGNSNTKKNVTFKNKISIKSHSKGVSMISGNFISENSDALFSLKEELLIKMNNVEINATDWKTLDLSKRRKHVILRLFFPEYSNMFLL